MFIGVGKNMNEKISEVIRQSEVSIMDTKCFKGHVDIEHLIELVVEECGRATFNYLHNGGSEYYLISSLREHFKV